ncbi:MAG: hypothetical protein ACI854_001190 [Arenicella sp.]|jgi:hypothetical protein
MTYPADAFFDIETLINVAQAERILVLGDCETNFLDNYVAQKRILNHQCTVVYLTTAEIQQLWLQDHPYDVAIVVDLFEHIDKAKAMQVLSRLRDVLSPQYCICLPLSADQNNSDWHLTDLFGFALSKVASYQQGEIEYGLFKYNISDYKKTPDWLNSDNWANPQMWGKYWW